MRPAAFNENPDEVFGTGGNGMLPYCLSNDHDLSWPAKSVEEGAVDAALRRDELSVVDAVFELDAPLPLLNR